MSNWLNTLRKKPKHERDNIAFAMSGGVTAFILVSVWFFGGIGPHALAGSADGSPHFFKTFFGEFGKQVATIKESLPEKKEIPATTTAQSFPESGPAASTSSNWAMASGTASTTAPPREIMIVTTSSTPATTSTTRQ